RALAMTRTVTSSWISRIWSGSAIRATPPSARMSAGTRSSAITATAPASSAIFACSASTTSMITPPFSISARPLLTRMVPTSAIVKSLAGEKRGHLVAKAVTRLHEDEVATGRQEHRPLVRDRGEVGRAGRPGDEVVLARDHERSGRDLGQAGTEVEGREDLRSEE